ncbi:MAG: HD domain-containing protein [Patescibacteria group bacterium]|nr:HD domain-containing protein [Patescibacteria group bacterium]MDD5294725.1 HD domain-containing protein [Patescibacteria group bacterium]MDD5554959.1 HD domain-containing protein [Patescibacteria group bacterium]
MGKKEVINKTKKYVRDRLGNEATGHDWWHAFRVWKTAKYIARKEGGDLFIIELAALLHDIADWKFNKGKKGLESKLIKNFLGKLKVNREIIKNVCEIVENMSFSLTGAKAKSRMKTKEGKIVQDADRLDALGAIGIARTFATGNFFSRPIFNPRIKINRRVEDLRKRDSYSSIHHFYDKLLLLKNLMNTDTGKKLATDRHKFLEKYLNQFFKEWNLK